MSTNQATVRSTVNVTLTLSRRCLSRHEETRVVVAMDLLSTAAFQRHHGQQLQLAFKLANATAAASAKLSSGVDALRDDYAQLEDEASEISVVRRVRELMRAVSQVSSTQSTVEILTGTELASLHLSQQSSRSLMIALQAPPATTAPISDTRPHKHHYRANFGVWSRATPTPCKPRNLHPNRSSQRVEPSWSGARRRLRPWSRRCNVSTRRRGARRRR